MQEVAIEGRLALLLQTKNGVNLTTRLVGQHATQKFYIRGGHFHIHLKVSARK